MKVVAKPNLEKQKNIIFRENHDFPPISADMRPFGEQIRAGRRRGRRDRQPSLPESPGGRNAAARGALQVVDQAGDAD